MKTLTKSVRNEILEISFTNQKQIVKNKNSKSLNFYLFIFILSVSVIATVLVQTGVINLYCD